MNGLDLLWEVIALIIGDFVVDTLLEDILINGVLAGIRDIIVTIFTGNILGIPGPVWAFIIILQVGAYTAIRRWQ